MKKYIVICLINVLIIFGHLSGYTQIRNEIDIPDIPGYKTLKCDFHLHTVFSDGKVWPTVRVDEALKEGLDAIAITDHIEYKPYKEYVSEDHNASYEIAKRYAQDKNIIVIKGGEITRDYPPEGPGHINAIFLKNVNLLDTENFIDAIKEADKQGAFIFWNHPGPPHHDTAKFYRIHKKLYEEGFMHGIEAANTNWIWPEVLNWCLEKDLTLLGNSDLHQPYKTAPLRTRDHERRFTTLVFAKEKSKPAIKDALLNHRTVVWAKDKIIGKEEYVKALFDESVEIKLIQDNNKYQQYKLTNHSDFSFCLSQIGNNGFISCCGEVIFKDIPLEPQSSVLIKLKEGETIANFVIKNCLIGKEKYLQISIPEFNNY